MKNNSVKFVIISVVMAFILFPWFSAVEAKNNEPENDMGTVDILQCPDRVPLEDLPYTTALDEEEIYDSLREMSEKELSALGYTAEEINKIKNNTFFLW